jgi:tRNA(Phe) wybutosine-synthesizing methylase Tyw3
MQTIVTRQIDLLVLLIDLVYANHSSYLTNILTGFGSHTSCSGRANIVDSPLYLSTGDKFVKETSLSHHRRASMKCVNSMPANIMPRLGYQSHRCAIG